MKYTIKCTYTLRNYNLKFVFGTLRAQREYFIVCMDVDLAHLGFASQAYLGYLIPVFKKKNMSTAEPICL